MIGSVAGHAGAEMDSGGGGSVVALGVFAGIALTASFVCSLSEAAILSLPKSQARALAQKGHLSGRILERMKERIEGPLNAILTLNTLANTVGAMGVGAQAAALFDNVLVGVVSGVMTYAVLVFGELIPKKIGAVYARRLAPLIALTITVMEYLMAPIVVVARPLTWVADRALARFGGKEPASVSRESLHAIAEIGTAEGTLTSHESEIIRNLMSLSRVRVHEVMTPRTRVFMLGAETTIDEAVRHERFTRYTRIPIYGEDQDEIRGVVIKGNLYEAMMRGEGARRVREFRRVLGAVPEQATLLHVLDLFGETGHHIFLVADEFGGTAGVVTLEDVLEAIMGREIVDETDEAADLRRLDPEHDGEGNNSAQGKE